MSPREKKPRRPARRRRRSLACCPVKRCFGAQRARRRRFPAALESGDPRREGMLRDPGCSSRRMAQSSSLRPGSYAALFVGGGWSSWWRLARRSEPDACPIVQLGGLLTWISAGLGGAFIRCTKPWLIGHPGHLRPDTLAALATRVAVLSEGFPINCGDQIQTSGAT